MLDTLDDHRAWLTETGTDDVRERNRYAAEIRRLVREDLAQMAQQELEGGGDPDAKLDEVLAPFREYLDGRGTDAG